MRFSTRRLRTAAAAFLAVAASVLMVAVPVAAHADGEYLPPSTTIAPPDTTGCGQQSVPPAAVDRSEAVPADVTYPAPLPVPTETVGGAALASCDFVLPAGASPVPSDLSAHAWMVADLTTGAVIGGKDVHGRYRPASTLKLLTMYVIWQRLPNFDQLVTGTAEDAGQEGSKVGIGPGGRYSVHDLMLGLMMNSGNDAAHALAMAAGGLDATVAQMNSTAAALGASDTRAATVSGLDGPGQQTSVYDLALIMRADLALPGFVDMIGTQAATFPGFDDRPAFDIAGDNKLLDNYSGAIGGKTGFTNDAGNTYVGVAERDGHRLVVTMLAGSQHPRRQWMQAASLLDWGFAAVGSGLAPVGSLVSPAEVAPESASDTASDTASDAGITDSSRTEAAEPGTAAVEPGTAVATPESAGSTGEMWFWAVGLAALAGALAILGRRHRATGSARRRPGAH